MSTSKLIAGLLGPTLIVSAISVIANLGAWPALVEDAARSPGHIMIAGYIAFAPGVANVYFHNHLTFAWPVLVGRAVTRKISRIVRRFRAPVPQSRGPPRCKRAPLRARPTRPAAQPSL